MKNIHFLNIILILAACNNCLFSKVQMPPAIKKALTAQAAQLVKSATKQDSLVQLKPAEQLKRPSPILLNGVSYYSSDDKKSAQDALDYLLYKAIRDKHSISEIKKLIKQGADVNKKFRISRWDVADATETPFELAISFPEEGTRFCLVENP